MSASRITAITDPDTTTVHFDYDGTTNRVISRTDRTGHAVYFVYDSANRLDTLRVDMIADPAIVTRLRSAESQAALSSVPLEVDSVYTVINGPRIDTTVTKLWLNRWGAPTKVVDALGHATKLVRGNASFPALVTSDTAANGFVTQATSISHGNISTSTSVGAYGGATQRTTHYYWNPIWDEPDSVVTPRGIVTQFGYDASTGNRIYSRPDRSRAEFTMVTTPSTSSTR